MTNQQEALIRSFQDRSEKVTKKALYMLWAEVASEFPECKSGDIDPETSNDLYCTVLNAVRTWAICNCPDEKGGG